MGRLVRGGDGLVLNKYRAKVDPIMQPMAKRLERVSPDALSWLAILFAALAGLLLYAAWWYGHHLLLLAFLAIVLNALFDALDGYVARLTGKASRLGDYLDHVLDRYADAFIFGGIAVSGYCHAPVGIVAIFGVFFTSYMGTQGQAIGLTRNYGGVLGRADRLALVLLFILVQWGLVVATEDPVLATLDIYGTAYALTPLELFMIIVAVLGNVTALQRGSAKRRAPSDEAASHASQVGAAARALGRARGIVGTALGALGHPYHH